MLIRVLILGFGLVTIGFVLTLVQNGVSSVPVSNSIENTRQNLHSAFNLPNLNEKLQPVFLAIVNSAEENYAVSVVDLKNNQKFAQNDGQTFDAASTVKILVAVYALEQVDQGKIRLENEIGKMPLEEHLRLMVNRSDNGSWQALNEYFGLAKIEDFGKVLGMKNTNLFDNKTTAYDLSILLTKIGADQVLEKQSRNKLLGWMQNTETEDRIPAALEADFSVYHKTGTFGGVVHDAAIIEGKDKKFVLIILSDGKTDAGDRLDTFRQITRAVLGAI